MNNLLSHCGLTGIRISVSEKDLPLTRIPFFCSNAPKVCEKVSRQNGTGCSVVATKPVPSS